RRAGAHSPPKEKPFQLRFPFFARAKQPPQRGRFARQPMNGKSFIKARKFGDDGFLSGIAFDLARRNEQGISSGSGVGHLCLRRKGRKNRRGGTSNGRLRKQQIKATILTHSRSLKGEWQDRVSVS